VNILNKQLRRADKGWSSRLGVGRGLATPHRRKSSSSLRNVIRSVGADFCEYGNEPLGSIKGRTCNRTAGAKITCLLFKNRDSSVGMRLG
jgi:hypothetical protein